MDSIFEVILRGLYPRPDPWERWTIMWGALGWHAAYHPCGPALDWASVCED